MAKLIFGTKMSPVQISKFPNLGELFIESKSGKSWLFYVKQTQTILQNGGFYETSKSCLMRVSKELLDPESIEEGQEIPGVIIQRQLSRNQFFEGQEPVINPESGEIIMMEGYPFYQNYTLVPEGEEPQVWVANEVEETVEAESTSEAF